MRFAVLIIASIAAGSAHGADVIHRCLAADGTTVYTDRPCDESGARPVAPAQPQREDGDASIERRAPGSTHGSGGAMSLGGAGRSDCVRRTDTLLFEVRAAVEAGNVNRLAGVYDWAGKSSNAAEGILDRLARITSRPLASVEFRYQAPDPYADPSLPLPPQEEVRPIGVHIEQLAPGDIVPTFEEDLRLVRNAACWWVSF